MLRFLLLSVIVAMLAGLAAWSAGLTSPASRPAATQRSTERITSGLQAAAQHDKTDAPASQPGAQPMVLEPGSRGIRPGMRLQEVEDVLAAPGVESSDDLAGTTVYEWSIPIDPNHCPDGRYGVRPLLANLRITVKHGRVASVHWE